jgi:exodeoxyribonuclease-5
MNSDTVIRCDWPPIIGLNEALERLNQSGLGHSAKILRELLSLEAYKPDPRPFADWARHWAAVLAKTGWPRAKGERLDSASFQVAERFQQVLAEVGTLDLVTPQMPDRERALSHLEGMLRSTLFQLEGPFGPIEVFDVAESAGLEFDALFLCGFVDEAWPPVPQSSHFIPAEQLIPPSLGGLAKVECPRATARNTRDYAKRITSMLFRSAPEVVIGLPEADGAGRVLRPSMLLPDSVIAHAQAAPASGCTNPWATAVQKIRDSLQGHITEQPELPLPVTPEEAQRITGGAYLLQAQSLCPVQAFLRYRMQLDPVEPEVLGLRSLEIGTIMHRVLELFWKDLPAYLQQGPSAKANHALLQSVLTTEVDGKKQQAIALNDQGRNFVKQCVESALMEPSIKARLCFLPEEYAQVLQAEILNLVEKWLCLEFAHPFDQIEGLELQENYQIKDLTLRLRVDRVQISDDEQVLIDYKGSKKFPSKAWLGMRPEEPQLPLYALILKRNNRPVGEIAFGVYGNEPCYVSMSRQKVLAKVPTSPTLVAELIGSGMLNDQEYLKKLLGVRGSEISQEALFKAVLDSYDSIIPRLLESFLAGSPILDPLVRRAHSPVPEVRNLACSTCAYQDVCRIREYLGHGSADDEDGEEEEPAE